MIFDNKTRNKGSGGHQDKKTQIETIVQTDNDDMVQMNVV